MFLVQEKWKMVILILQNKFAISLIPKKFSMERCMIDSVASDLGKAAALEIYTTLVTTCLKTTGLTNYVRGVSSEGNWFRADVGGVVDFTDLTPDEWSFR